MIQILKSNERGKTRLEWLDSRHSFSFGEYHDPARMGFGHLRVINEDVIAPMMEGKAQGFGAHPHRDMEIVTYLLGGSLQHKDSLGNGSTIHTGEVQYMSAGTGIVHSEFNPSREQPAHLLQIWILSQSRGLPPAYAQQDFSAKRAPGTATLLLSPEGRDGSLVLRQRMYVYALDLEPNGQYVFDLPKGGSAWAQMAGGVATLGAHRLEQGDAAATQQEARLEFRAETQAEILLFLEP